MEQAYDTYRTIEKRYAGIYGEATEPLVPISHQIINADIEITLNEAGNLLNACMVAKKNAAIIAPVHGRLDKPMNTRRHSRIKE